MYFEDVAVGQEVPPLRRRMGLAALVAYAAATWDFHRYHYDAEYVRSLGLRAPFVDGQMFGALLAKQLMDWAGPDAFLRRLAFRNRSLVYAGEQVVCQGKVAEKRVEGGLHLVACTLSVTGEDGRQVVDAASAEIDLPVRTAPAGPGTRPS